MELEEQRYLILECKVWIFKDVVHQNDEFAHDSSERNFGRFARRPQPLVKLFKLAVGVSSNECCHVECTADRRATAADAAASMPLTAFAWMRCQSC